MISFARASRKFVTIQLRYFNAAITLRLYHSYFQLKGRYKTRRNIEWLRDIMNSKHVIRSASRGHHVHTIRRCYSSLSQSRNIIVMLIIIYRPRCCVIKFTVTWRGCFSIATERLHEFLYFKPFQTFLAPRKNYFQKFVIKLTILSTRRQI